MRRSSHAPAIESVGRALTKTKGSSVVAGSSRTARSSARPFIGAMSTSLTMTSTGAARSMSRASPPSRALRTSKPPRRRRSAWTRRVTGLSSTRSTVGPVPTGAGAGGPVADGDGRPAESSSWPRRMRARPSCRAETVSASTAMASASPAASASRSMPSAAVATGSRPTVAAAPRSSRACAAISASAVGASCPRRARAAARSMASRCVPVSSAKGVRRASVSGTPLGSVAAGRS